MPDLYSQDPNDQVVDLPGEEDPERDPAAAAWVEEIDQAADPEDPEDPANLRDDRGSRNAVRKAAKNGRTGRRASPSGKPKRGTSNARITLSGSCFCKLLCFFPGSAPRSSPLPIVC